MWEWSRLTLPSPTSSHGIGRLEGSPQVASTSSSRAREASFEGAARAVQRGRRAGGHLQAHSLVTDVCSRPLRAAGHRHLDGVQAVISHLHGYSVAITTFYGHPSVGFSGPNVARFQKLGALLNY